MDTILRHNGIFKKLFESISFKVFFICLLFAAIAVFTYIFSSYQSIYSTTLETKKDGLISAASDFSASLSAYASTPQNSTTPAPGIKRRIIITDNNLKVTYDSSTIEGLTSKTLFLSPSLKALRGETFFEGKLASDCFMSTLALPLTKDEKITGTILILENDESVFLIFKNLLFASLIASIVTLFLFILVFLAVSYLLTKRISKLMLSIKKSREQSSTEKIPVLRNDEISPVINEFNNIYEELSYVQQMRQIFVSDASHELRTPLSAIKLLCDSITGTDEVDPETTKEFLSDIVLEVDRMSHTAEKLLVLSKLDNSSQSTLSPVPLSDIVCNAITALSPFASDKNIEILSYIEDDCIILGEMEGTSQIVGNIIDNAIKYNNNGGKIKVYVFSKNENCHFIVDDTGIGIAPEEREQVFERFYRVDKSRKHDGRGGSGLGLAIVKRNVESFGGNISISESPCGGSRFTVIFQGLPTQEEEAYL